MKTQYITGAAVFCAALTLAMWMAGVWTGDPRWGLTGTLVLFPAIGLFAWASISNHDDRCGGC